MNFLSRAILGALIIIVAPPSIVVAQQNLSWDVNGATAGTGGTGAWNTTSPFWSNGVAFQVWNNATLDNAIFAGAAGTVTLASISAHNLTFNVGGYTLAGTSLTFGGINPTVTTNTAVTTINAPLAGGLGFIKEGGGTLALGGNSSAYTGVTTVNAGSLRVNTANALGLSISASNLVLNNGATFIFGANFTHNFTLTGGVVSVQSGGIFTWSGSPTLTAATTLNLNSAITNGTLSGNLADTGANVLAVTRNSSGRVILSGINSYTGATTITQGNLQLNSASALSAGSNLIFNGVIGTGGAIELTSASGNFARSVGIGAAQVRWTGDGGFLSSGSSRIVNLGGAGALLTWGSGEFVPTGNRLILGTNSNSGLDFQNAIDLTGGIRAVQGDGGVITGHARISGILSGTGGLAHVGNGFLELTAANTYTGGTIVTSGVLVISSDANLGAASGVFTFNGGTLLNTAAFATSRSITVAAPGGTFQTNANLIVSGLIEGPGHLTKTGTNSLTLTGTNTYTGGTTISAGTLLIGNGGTTGSIVGDVVNNAALVFNRSNASIFGGVISGTGILEQRGSGTTVLAGGNTYSGGTTISAGTLQIGDGGTTGSIVGNVINNGVLAFDHSDSITFSGLVAGVGSLEQRGSGTLMLTGSNTYTGPTILNAGTLSVASDSNLGAASSIVIFNGGTLQNTAAFATSRSMVLNAADGAFKTDFDLLVSGPISGTGRLIKLGPATLTLTSNNTYSGGTIINAGTLQIGNAGTTGSIQGDVLNNGVLIFNRSDVLAFDGSISGAGSVEQRGGGTLVFTGNSAAFAGVTSIFAGTLMVNGLLGGTIDVLSSGRLQGIGTVGTVNVTSGGTLVPGAPFGTMTATGNVTFAANSIYEVKTDSAGIITLMHAAGTATINGGTVRVVTEGSVFRTGARYTILTADAGRSGQFNALTETLPLIDMTLAYDLNNVYLDVARNSTTLCSLAVTRNQCATSTTGVSLGSGNPVFDAVVSLPDLASIQRALDLLSGEIHASTKSALIENSRYIRDATIERSRPVIISRDGTWGRIFGSSGHHDSDGNAARIDSSIGGLFVGADAAIADKVLVGLAAGYSSSSLSVSKRSSFAASDDYHLALYGGTQWGAFGLRVGAAYAWHDVQGSRSIIFPGFADIAKASYGAQTAQVFGETGYALSLGGIRLEPFGQLAQVSLSGDSFDESGGAAALSVLRSRENVTYSTIGLRIAQSFTGSNDWTATARGTFGWRHAFGDLIPLSTHSIGDSSTFAIAGIPISDDTLVINTGIEIGLGGNSVLSLTHDGQISHGGMEHGVRANLSFRF